MKLIGIAGRRHAGKDTAYGSIVLWSVQRGLIAERRGFADKLKLSAARIFEPDISLEDAVAWCDEVKEHGELSVLNDLRREGIEISGRQFLQHYGTEAHRDVFGSDFWVDAVLPPGGWNGADPPEFWGNFPGADFAVVTDVRFPNEAERVLELPDGEVWEIVRQDNETDDIHASETPLSSDLVSFTLVNDGTLTEFKNKVMNAMTVRFPEEAEATR